MRRGCAQQPKILLDTSCANHDCIAVHELNCGCACVQHNTRGRVEMLSWASGRAVSFWRIVSSNCGHAVHAVHCCSALGFSVAINNTYCRAGFLAKRRQVLLVTRERLYLRCRGAVARWRRSVYSYGHKWRRAGLLGAVSRRTSRLRLRRAWFHNERRGTATCRSIRAGTCGACVLWATETNDCDPGALAMRRALRRARFLYSG